MLCKVGEKYKVNVKSGRFYIASILSEDEMFLHFIDKNGRKVAVAKSEISEIKEHGGD